MVKRHSRTPRIPRIFTPPGPHDPLGNFLAEAGNILAENALHIVSNAVEKRFFGKAATSPEEKYLNDSYSISLQKQEADLAKAHTQQLKAAEQLKLTEYKVTEKEI